MKNTFICGETNREAYQAVKQLIGEICPEKDSGHKENCGYKPLVIYGPTGTGKTELLQMLSSEIQKYQPGLHVVLKHGLDFLNEYVETIRYRTFDAFLHRYMEADVLLLDSIQLLGIQPLIAAAYTKILNGLRAQNTVIVITADLTEEEWSAAGKSIYGPLMPCRIVEVKLPDRLLRKQLIKMYAGENDFPLADEMADLLAKHTEGKNVRLLQIAVSWIQQYQESHAVSVEQAVKAFLDAGENGYRLPHL